MFARQEGLRAASVARVLDALRRAGRATRAELSALSGLAPSTVAGVIVELRERGLVELEPVPAKGRGRPQSLLKMRADALRIAGAFPETDGLLRFVIAGADGEVLHAETVDYRLAYGAAVGEQLTEAVADLVGRAPAPLRKIDALGVAFPGLVDSRDGSVLWAGVDVTPPLPLAEMLEERLGAPTFIESTIIARARGERLYGEGRDVDDFALITSHLGLGQYIGGQLWTGPRGLNPEFRHHKVSLESDRLCSCGATGCLGTFAGSYTLALVGCELLGLAKPDLADVGPALSDLIATARAGDQRLVELFDQAGIALGSALANIANLHDPTRIIVTFANQDLLDIVREPFIHAMKAKVYPADRLPDLRLRVDDFGTVVLGAVAHALERVVTSA